MCGYELLGIRTRLMDLVGGVRAVDSAPLPRGARSVLGRVGGVERRGVGGL